jgi:histidine triad (HIT) family protein
MCIFCKIVEGEIPSNKVLEDENFLAFHDINPTAPVHVLVIPKEHIESFQETPGEVMAKMTPFIQEVAKKLCLDKNGYRVVTNVGKDGGQEVKHLHFHILGGGKLIWKHYQEIDPHKSI